MPAAFNVMLDTGGSNGNPGTSTNIDPLGPPNLRFKQADNATIDTNDPIPIPTSGTSYSRWKQIYLKCTTAPSVKVDNVKFYTDGTGFGTGITMRVATNFPTKNSGSSSGYAVASTNTSVANHPNVTGTADAFTYTQASPLNGPTISESGNAIDAVNETTNYVVLGLEVTNTASPGDLANETLTFQYDEI